MSVGGYNSSLREEQSVFFSVFCSRGITSPQGAVASAGLGHKVLILHQNHQRTEELEPHPL